MKTCTEMRNETWSILWKGGWLRRLAGILCLFAMINWVFTAILRELIGGGVIDEQRLMSMTSATEVWEYLGNPAMIRNLLLVYGLSLFISAILNGIFALGRSFVELRAARNYSGKLWFKGTLAGFSRPLELCWFYACWFLRVWWVLVFIVSPLFALFIGTIKAGDPQFLYLLSLPLAAFPLVSFYRYRQAWYLKAANQDWPVGKCLAESARMMDGKKWLNFKYDCTFWKPVTLLLLVFAAKVMIALSALAVYPDDGAESGPNALFTILAVAVAFFTNIYLGLGQAVFHRELLGAGVTGGTDNGKDVQD